MSSAKLIFFGPPFAPSAAGASPPAPVETAPPAEGATAGSTAGSAIQTGRAVPARRVFSRLESPAGAGAGAGGGLESGKHAARGDGATCLDRGAGGASGGRALGRRCGLDRRGRRGSRGRRREGGSEEDELRGAHGVGGTLRISKRGGFRRVLKSRRGTKL